MKAIKDTEVRVKIYDCYGDSGDWEWLAYLSPETGSQSVLSCTKYYAHKSSCKRNWVKFARLNGIDNWRYV